VMICDAAEVEDRVEDRVEVFAVGAVVLKD
jgi:hypothetical protein